MPIVSKITEISSDPYKILISTIISLRTKDAVTEAASLKLFNEADTPEKMVKLPKSRVEKIIYPAGFFRNKAESIIEISKIIIERYDGKVPSELNLLLALPGVGRKTANLVLSLGFHIDAICVDTHVHRISNRFGLVKTKNPEETEFALMKVLPKNWWIIYNDMLVTWGQNICKPINPKCKICSISNFCKKVGVDKKYTM